MDQRSIVICLARKELSAIAIHHDLAATLGPEAVGYSSVTCYIREAILISSNSPANIPEANPSSTILTKLFSSHSPKSRLRQFES
jgi:hypothetical protein